jgi:ABC-2 type transport system permease protein
MNEFSAIATIATRDLVKFLRDRSRLALAVLVPFLLMFLLGSTVQRTLGHAPGFNFIAFTFTGVLGMMVFQSSVQGLASLLDDRQNDFAQELFVAPVSRYALVCGKILGETMVALAQTIPLVVFAVVLRVPMTLEQVALLAPVALVSCLLGGSFGLVAMSAINSQQAANQIFNFLLLPQLFLAGVFAPITARPWYMECMAMRGRPVAQFLMGRG